MKFQEVRVQVHLPLPSSQVVPVHVDHDNDLQEQQINDQAPLNDVVTYHSVPQEVALRRSLRERRYAISGD